MSPVASQSLRLSRLPGLAKLSRYPFPMRPLKRGKTRKLIKDAGLGLLVAVALFGLSELALWTLGLGDPRSRVHLSRGFDASAARPWTSSAILPSAARNAP